MVHILPSNHEIITSWRFHPNLNTFERVISVNSFLSFLAWKFLSVRNGSKWSKMVKKKLYCFFLRIEWFWVKKNKKTFLTIFGSGGPFLGPFCPFFRKMGLFSKNLFLHVFSPYGPLTSCKELGKSLEPFSRAPEGVIRKIRFWPFWPIFPNLRFFSKNLFLHVFY